MQHVLHIDCPPELLLSLHMNAEEMADWIHEAELESGCTCEVCGAPGDLRGTGWLYTACDAHVHPKDV